MSRELARAARRLADATTTRLSDAARSGPIIATVTTVTAGAASDGNALVKVTWRGVEFTAAGFDAAYTPAVGHRVLLVMADNQPIILGHIVGHP